MKDLKELHQYVIKAQLASCINFLESIERHISEQQDIYENQYKKQKSEVKSNVEMRKLKWDYETVWDNWGYSFPNILRKSVFMCQYFICEKEAGENIKKLPKENEIVIFGTLRHMIAHNDGKLKDRKKEVEASTRKYVEDSKGISLDSNDYIEIKKEFCTHANEVIKSYLTDLWLKGVKSKY